jgi:ABC-2 type transport system ATP-binding protein
MGLIAQAGGIFYAMPPVIIVEHLLKRYKDVVAVADASFEVGQGEIFGLLGSNGAGKTTTVECLQGLRCPEGGELRVLDLDPRTQARTLRRRIGSQLQESALPDHVRVWEALDLFSSITPGGLGWREVMAQWGLEDKRKASFHGLSGGQRQRLFIALALVNDPELVFLDEMTTGLDPGARRVAWDLVRQVRGMGTTVVLVTHFMEEAERLCDRIAVMDAGRIVAEGTPQDLIADHAQFVTVVFSTDIRRLEWLTSVRHVQGVVRHGVRVEVQGRGPVLAEVAAALVAHGITPSDLRVEQPTLEEVFLALTGHSVEV